MGWFITNGGAGGGGTQTIDQLLDVDTTSSPPLNGQLLGWSAALNNWVPANSTTIPPTVLSVTPTPGQTGFILPTAPTAPASLRLLVNGIEYYNADSYTLAGLNITWLNEFRLDPSDELRLVYA